MIRYLKNLTVLILGCIGGVLISIAGLDAFFALPLGSINWDLGVTSPLAQELAWDAGVTVAGLVFGFGGWITIMLARKTLRFLN